MIKSSKSVAFSDKILLILVVILLGLISQDKLVIGLYLFIFPYLYFTGRKKHFSYIYISSVISIIWMLIANNEYGYNKDLITIFGLNSFPLFAWPLGLFAGYLLYSYAQKFYQFKHPIKKILLFVCIYWSILLSLETIAYHLFNIHNVATGMYQGLPICGCIHAPTWMQISYLILGPIYFSICEILGLENPIKQN